MGKDHHCRTCEVCVHSRIDESQQFAYVVISFLRKVKVFAAFAGLPLTTSVTYQLISEHRGVVAQKAFVEEQSFFTNLQQSNEWVLWHIPFFNFVWF